MSELKKGSILFDGKEFSFLTKEPIDRKSCYKYCEAGWLFISEKSISFMEVISCSKEDIENSKFFTLGPK